MTQYEIIGRLISRKRGATAMDIVFSAGTVCPHKRMSDMKAQGWAIVKKQVNGENHHTYHGISPKTKAATRANG